MQHNILSNYLLFYSIIESEECYKLISFLRTMPTEKIQVQHYEYYLYECKKEMKITVNFKQKVSKQEFELRAIRNEELVFMYSCEKSGIIGNARGSLVLAERDFIDLVLKNQKLLEEKVEVERRGFQIEGLRWENYLFYWVELPGDKVVLIIQQINGSTLCKKNEENKELSDRLENYFLPILEQLFSIKAQEQLNKYLAELKDIKKCYPELTKTIDREKGIQEVDFTLLFFYAINKGFGCLYGTKEKEKEQQK